MADFKKGDVVFLKSGSPRMTINAVQSDGTLWCIWFDKKGNQQGGQFDPEDLTKPSPPTGPSVVNF